MTPRFSPTQIHDDPEMKAYILFCIACSAILASTAALADEIPIVNNVLGPEGPLYVDGSLYYVSWIGNTLSKWDGKAVTVLNDAAGCGHNGLALTKQHTLMIACTNNPGAIIEVALTGKELRRWVADANGRKFDGGINDVLVTANGGIYATVFGPFVDPPTFVMGRILYLAPGSQNWIQVADDLNYANGLAGR